MAPKIIEGRVALQNFRSNPYARQPTRNDPDNRIEPVCLPGFKPSFRLSAGERIFTIGSCFARNVESLLDEHGFDVIARSPDAKTLFDDVGMNAINNFGVPSIYNELDWAIGGGFDPEFNFIEISPGLFCDLHLPPTIRPAPIADVARRREKILRLTRQVADCSVVIITLGLTEVWFDKLGQRYLNFTPRKAVLNRSPDRFEIHILDYSTTMSFLTKTIELLLNVCKKNLKIVLTVSPVPLIGTFTQQDVIVANSYSKSLLCVAAQDIAARFPDVDYYPSYESVTQSNRDIAWEDDLRHVRPQLISTNVSRLVEQYTSESGEDTSKTFVALSQARILIDDGSPHAALEMLGTIPADYQTPNVALLKAEAYALTGEADQAHRTLATVKADAGWPRRLAEIRVHIALTEGNAALKLALAWAAEEPAHSAAQRALAEACLNLGLWDQAIEAARKYTLLERGRGEPFALLAQVYRRMGNPQAAEKTYLTGLRQKHESPALSFSYLSFLIEQNRTEEAENMATIIVPDGDFEAARLSRMRALIRDRKTVRSMPASLGRQSSRVT